MLQILDTFVIILFVLFMIYIFRGYHISKRAQDEKDFPETSAADATLKNSNDSNLDNETGDGKSGN